MKKTCEYEVPTIIIYGLDRNDVVSCSLKLETTSPDERGDDDSKFGNFF